MQQHRHAIATALICAAFVSVTAAMRADRNHDDANEQTSSAIDAVQSSKASLEDDIEREFFSSLAVQASETEPAAPAAPQPPVVTAESYIVGDLVTGQIYLEKNSSAVLPFASMSKLVTAIIATREYSLVDTIEISTTSTQVPPDASALKAGEKLTVGEILKPLLVSSSNVAAEALASAGGERIAFLESMSSYVWEIGMLDSYFADPTGLSPRNAGTAKGFFTLARHLYDTRQDILQISRTQNVVMATTTEHGGHSFASTHPFVGDPRFRGGKTGRTPEALETMLTIMEIKGRPIAIVVLRSNWARESDTNLLIKQVEEML